MRVPFSYLDRQFSDIETFLDDLRHFVPSGDFTLGAPLQKFEKDFANYCEAPHGIGVASGTDALIIALKLLGVGPGDEVITTPMTFIATGAIPRFVDSEDGFVIDANKIEAAINESTKAILPVHYTGNLADMPRIREIADQHQLAVVEDACQAIGGRINGHAVGYWSDATAFSFHPLKNLNVWSDGGMIITHSDDLAEKIRLYRNHGLINRDEVKSFGVNSRLDTLQALIANRLMPSMPEGLKRRRDIAQQYDDAFKKLSSHIQVPHRRKEVEHAFHLYLLRVEQRNDLLEFLIGQGIEAKIHYPIPLHLQEAALELGYKRGDFPQCEADCEKIITLPVHQYLNEDEITFVIKQVQEFYSKKLVSL